MPEDALLSDLPRASDALTSTTWKPSSLYPVQRREAQLTHCEAMLVVVAGFTRFRCHVHTANSATAMPISSRGCGLLQMPSG